MKKILLFVLISTLVVLAQPRRTYPVKIDTGYFQYNHDTLSAKYIYYVDTLQLMLTSDKKLILSPYMNGHHTFSGTNTSDTVLVMGLDTNDVAIVSPVSSSYNVNNSLTIEKKNGKIIVHRNTGGISGLTWNWIWIRRYN